MSSEWIVILWFFATNCNDSNYILMHYIVIEFYLFSFIFLYQFYYKTIAVLGFSFNSCFLGKIHREGSMVALENNFEEWAFAWSYCSGRFALTPTWSIAWHTNVTREIAIGVMSLFKLEIWKTLGNHILS